MLSPTDPTPFEIVNRTGLAPLIIACDHASNRVPQALMNLGLNRDDLEKHIGYDIGARQVALALSQMFDAPLISANYSRLVVDLNRHPDDLSLIVDVSDNIPIPGNQKLTEAQKLSRIEAIFLPYHSAYEELVEEVGKNHVSPIILSVHSFTPSMAGQNRPWHYGVLWDEAHELLAREIISNFEQIDGLNVGDNQPYHANDPRGYAQVIHAEENQLQMALIEIRQDIVSSVSGQEKAASTLHQVMMPILSRLPN